MGYKDVVNELQTICVEHGDCQKRTRLLEEELLISQNATEELKDKLETFSNKVKFVDDDLVNEVSDVPTQQCMKTRVEMMMESKRGEWESMNLDKSIQIYNEAYPVDAMQWDGEGDRNYSPNGSETASKDAHVADISENE